MVTVYHGTTPDRFKKIMADKAISVTTNDNKRYPNTSCGAVYVTKNLCDAMDFSTRPELGLTKRCIVVFRIQISESELEHDPDENHWQSTMSDQGDKYCYRIKRNLTFEKDIDRIFIKDFEGDNSKLGRYIQSIQYNEIKIKEDEWISPKDLFNLYEVKTE